ncbi:M15 family metallopeptidase [Shewanella yunxiaonensis]|nr:M15 family metallopeptidase [Shewanella yunxiaonensis]
MLIFPKNRLYGLDDSGLIMVQSHDQRRFLMEPQAAAALQKLQQAAAADGITVDICSAHRSFERQRQIWNAKASGQRPLLDVHSKPIMHIETLSDQELLQTLLLWSALPGTSRHHWGTDIDLFDSQALTRDKLQLINDEYQPGGPCHTMHQWLDQHAAIFGFYRPFQAALSGTSAELWHYSYYPIANEMLRAYDVRQLAAILIQQEISLKPAILEQLAELVRYYVQTVAPVPDAAQITR